MKRQISGASSGSSADEFFDAVENLDDNPQQHNRSNGKSPGRSRRNNNRFQSLAESNLEENSQSSAERQEAEEELWVLAKSFQNQVSDGSIRRAEHPPPPPTSLQDTEDVWVSAKSTMSKVPSLSREETWNDRLHTPSMSLIDNMASASESASYSYEEISDQIPFEPENATPAEPIVPPLNMSLVPRARTNSDLYTVPSEEIKQIVEKEYDARDLQTLNRLVDKLQAAELSRPVVKEEDASQPVNEEQTTIVDGQEIVLQKNETVQKESPERFLTPQKIDCITNFVRCDVKSPLEALYLFCPQGMGYTPTRGGSKKGIGNGNAAIATSPVRTSVTNEDDLSENVPPIVPSLSVSEHGRNETVERQLVLDSDSSSDTDSSSSPYKYQMVNKDTGSTHDVRDVMKQIEEAGSSDALDTRYSILPTKNQLESQRIISLEVDSKESEESPVPVAIPLATASFDSAAMEVEVDTTPKQTERKKGAVKFRSKFASSIKGLKTSRQQKLNRKRTASADMLPSNAIHARSSSRKKDSRNNLPEHAQETPQADSSFNPMLLIKTLPNAHTGPAWCASFSPNGRFLATGGEDGNVCIWAVAPKSKSMHPNGVNTAKEQGSDDEESGSEEDEIGETNEKEDPNSSAPPLNFIGTGPELATNLEILSSEPIQRFKDHTADVIDLSWSHTNFLLSASLDSTVRLYHFSKPGCLHLFKHANLVASVAFHPNDDRYFISGGIDKKLRLWDITDGRVKEWAQAPDVITAARFTPDGKYAVAGMFRGQVYFYNVEGLKYYTQIACRNRNGKHRQGKKVTGISFARGERDDWLEAVQQHVPEDEEAASSNADSHTTLREKLSDTRKDIGRRASALLGRDNRAETLRYTERMLVSTNDSRVRLYGLNDFQMVRKYKGHTNYSMQIRARISESGSHIICGSESGHCFIWETLDKNRPKKSVMKVNQTHDKTKSSDQFEASRAPLPIITDSVFFPSRSMNEALVSSDKVFPFVLGMDRVDDDMSSAAILTLDYDGTMRVFLRKSCIDNILDAATPRGGTMT